MNLREFRKEQKLSQDNMARQLGMSLSMYAKVEGGHADVSRGFMQKLKAKYPSVSIDKLFFSEEAAQ